MHIVEGRPWRKALERLAEGDVSGRRPWHGAKDYGDRDLLLTVLSTDPRMVVSVEVGVERLRDHLRWTPVGQE